MNEVRRIITLDGDWDFAYTKEAPESGNCLLPDEEAYEVQIPVPAYWDDCKKRLKYAKFWSRGCVFNPEYRQIEFPMGGLKPPDASLPYLIGTGWYRRRFRAEEGWTDKTVVLHVGGVTLEAWVWLNGTFLGHHVGHLTPFELNLKISNGENGKRALIPGEENELVIAVSNTRTDRTGCSIRGFKGKSAGITRSVNIQVTGESRINDCYVRSDAKMKELVWQVEILHGGAPVAEPVLEWKIIDPVSSLTVAEGGEAAKEGVMTWKTGTLGMEPWSDNQPHLYKLCFTLRDGERKIDVCSQAFGLRYIEREGRGILLNGKPILLRGLTEHAYFPETCTVPTDVSYYMNSIKALKGLGYNWMRFHTWTPPKECLEAADKLGMMIQVEAPNGFMESDFLDIIRTCRNHPSVILYCCGNEVPIDDEMEAKLERMAGLCHELAPDCMFNPMGALLNIECRLDEKEPGYTELPVPHNKIKLEKIKSYSDVFSPGVWVFSYHSLYHNDEKIKEKFEIYDRPCLVHEAGINDTYLNLDLEHRYDYTRIGTGLFTAAREYITEMGLIQNAPVYYQNSCRWMRQIIKFSMEKARRCQYVTGYDYLGASDCHWHRTGYAVGLLNEFYEPKAGFTSEDVLQFNGESVLLSDSGPERNFSAEDTIKVKLSVSLFGSDPIEQGRLSWHLEEDNGSVYSRGQIEGLNVINGRITELGEIDVILPDTVAQGKHVTLKARLSGGAYELTNHWDYWVFPKEEVKTADRSDVMIVRQLDEETINFMTGGGRVLLLSRGPFPGLPISYQIMSGGRVNGNCATVVYDHPMMRDFPHDGFCDWQFYPLIKGGGTIVFNDLDIPFDPIVEIVSSYKLIRKQASIFELGVGAGGLLVCTLNLINQDPGAADLYNCMLRYISSDEFKPKSVVTEEWMRELIENNHDLTVDFTTDECYDTGGQIEV